MIEQALRKLRLMIGLGIAKLVDDTRQIQALQVTALDGEVRDNINRMQDYGFTSVPLDDPEVVLAAVGGNRNHLIAIRCDHGRYRKRNLAAGEVCMYNKDGDYILFKEGRIIEVVAGNKVKVTSPEVEIVASTKLTITSPTVEMSGNLTVTGTIDGGTVKQGSVVLGTHVHSGVQSGGSNTGGPI